MSLSLFSKKQPDQPGNSASNDALSGSSNVVIHTMPKSFIRKKAGQAGKNHSLGLVILIVGVFALLAVFAVLYVYLSETQVAAPLVSVSEQYSDDAEADKLPDKPMPAEDRLDDSLASGEEDTASSAAEAGSEVTASSSPANEEPAQIATSTEVALETAPGTAKETGLDLAWQADQDSDQDGLYDPEELLLGLNINAIDSDSDSYGDYSEFFNMYNPAGEGKISDHPNIATYNNSSYFYSFKYPKSWQAEKAGSDASIMLQPDTRQFIQIIVADNPDGLPLDAWFRNELGRTDISGDRRLEKTGWQALMSDNGLTVYLQKDNQANIFALSYNLGVGSIASYKNIFEFIIKSFSAD